MTVMRRLVFLFFFSALLLSTHAAYPSVDALERIGEALRAARKGNAQTTCPFRPEDLVGLTKGEIESALGPPDYFSGGAGDYSASPEWSYLFTEVSRDPSGSRGGGYPELELTFDGDGTVKQSSCSYAR